MKGKDFVTGLEAGARDIDDLLNLSLKLKKHQKSDAKARPLNGMSVAVIFEKPSTRTRVSFEVGLFQLGAHSVVLSGRDMQLGRGETIEDTGRVLARYCDAIVIRTFEQAKLEALARAATVPVINALSDLYHPCQALADMLTIRERRGNLAGLKLAYFGDGNNVCHSLLLASATAGMNMTVACPADYQPAPAVLAIANKLAIDSGSQIVITDDARAAADKADALYTDVWVSMGQEDEKSARLTALAPYRIDEAILGAAKSDALVMHCLPAHRGQEISAAVLDGPNSVILDQAENRLHAQKALMVMLMKPRGER